MPGRTGAVAVAALALVPLAVFAAKRRWGAFVLGGTVAVLALMLVPDLFVRFSNAVSLSQSRRAAGFVPFAFAFAGGLALVARSIWVLPFAFLAGVALEHKWPGDFAYGLREGGPGEVTWFALIAGAVALVLGVVLARERPKERWTLGALAACLFVLPVAVHGFRRWTPLNKTDPDRPLARARAAPPRPSRGRGCDRVAQDRATRSPPPRPSTSSPLRRRTWRTRRRTIPTRRVDEVNRWLATGDPAIPRRYGATWAVRGGRLIPLRS